MTDAQIRKSMFIPKLNITRTIAAAGLLIASTGVALAATQPTRAEIGGAPPFVRKDGIFRLLTFGL